MTPTSILGNKGLFPRAWSSVLLLAGAALLTACAARSMRPREVILVAPEVELPARWHAPKGVITVETFVNGDGPFQFLLDTGANIILVSPGVSRSRSGPGSPVMGTIEARDVAGNPSDLDEPARFESLRTGGVELRDVDALVARLDDLSRLLGVQVDGVLGCPAFGDGCLTIDHIESRVSFGRAALSPVDDIGVFPLLERGKPLIALQIGEDSVPLLIDSAHTGGIHLAGLPSCVAREVLPLPAELVWGPTGKCISERWTRIHGTLRLGAIVMQDPVLLVGADRRQGVVGTRVLKHYCVSIDFANGRVAFKGGPRSAVFDSPIGTGATLGPGEEGIQIVRLLPGSPAQVCGLRVGDRVIAVNELPTNAENEPEIGRALRRYGTRVRFTISREDGLAIVEVPVEELHP